MTSSTIRISDETKKLLDELPYGKLSYDRLIRKLIEDANKKVKT